MNILILDLETGGLDPANDHIVEVACILWSVTCATSLASYSTIIGGAKNDSEKVNRISANAIREAKRLDTLEWDPVVMMAEAACAVVAHNAAFDRAFVEKATAEFDKPWVCTIEDFDWPRKSQSQSLIAIALEHGVPVTEAHRALPDCQLIARLLERVEELGLGMTGRIKKAIEHAQLPKAEVHSLQPFDQNDIAKAHGFHWDGDRRVWHRTMAVKDADALPFRWEIMAEAERQRETERGTT